MTFENYLMEYFCKVEPTILDDDIPDAFVDWLEKIDIEDVIDCAEKWHTQEIKNIKIN
jgi:hypothetical protein